MRRALLIGGLLCFGTGALCAQESGTDFARFAAQLREYATLSEAAMTKVQPDGSRVIRIWKEVPIVRADDWPYAIDGVPHVLTTYRASYRYQWLRIEPVRVQALATAYVLRGLLLGHRSFTCTVEAANGCWSVSARRSDYPNEHELQARLQRRHAICSARRRQIRSRIPRLRG
jgi:hypothetical protein